MPDAPIVLRVDGLPVGKGRPRFVKQTGRTFTPGDTKRHENRVQLAWLAAGRPRLPDGPAIIGVELVVPRPQNHWRQDGTLSAAGERAEWPVRKPDVDNALKLVMDALNGCAYRDDVDLVYAAITRRWANPGEHAHTVIRLQPARGPRPPLRAVTDLLQPARSVGRGPRAVTDLDSAA